MSTAAAPLRPAFDVFVSHSREDWPIVERIVRSLTFGGRVRVHTDRMLAAGEDWRSRLRRALETTHVFIVIGSPAAASSDFVLQELGGAWALGKSIVVGPLKGKSNGRLPLSRRHIRG
jgi:hypothetical protein